MFEHKSNEKFGALSGFYPQGNPSKIDKSLFNYDDLDKLRNDPTKNMEEKRKEKIRIESELGQYNNLDLSMKYLMNTVAELRLQNRKLKKINDNLSKFYFRYKDSVDKMDNMTYEQSYVITGDKNSEENDQRKGEKIQSLERKIHVLVLEKEEMGLRYEESFKKIQKLQKKNFDLKEKNHILTQQVQSKASNLGTSYPKMVNSQEAENSNLISFQREQDIELQESSFASPNIPKLEINRNQNFKSERIVPMMKTIHEEHGSIGSVREDSSRVLERRKMKELEEDNRKLARFLKMVRGKLKAVEEELQGYKGNYA